MTTPPEPPPAPSGRKPLNLVFALGALGLAVVAVQSPTLGAAGLLVAAGWIATARGFAVREDAEDDGDRWHQLMSLPGLLVAGPALPLAGVFGTWPWPAIGLFVAGALGFATGAWMLGGSFGLLPARRGIVRRGFYGWVRHPMYGSQILMVSGVGWAIGGLGGAAFVAFAVACIGLRCWVEEDLLRRDPEYVRYAEDVRWWWVPGVF